MENEKHLPTIEELEAFFAAQKLPGTISLHKAVRITDVPKFVKSHLALVKERGTDFGGFYERLCQAWKILGGEKAAPEPGEESPVE